MLNWHESQEESPLPTCPLVLPESFFLRQGASRPKYWISQDLWVFHHTVGKILWPTRCLAIIVVFKAHHKQVFRHNFYHHLRVSSIETWRGKGVWASVTGAWLSTVEVQFPLAGHRASELLKSATASLPGNCVELGSPTLCLHWRSRLRFWLTST